MAEQPHILQENGAVHVHRDTLEIIVKKVGCFDLYFIHLSFLCGAKELHGGTSC